MLYTGKLIAAELYDDSSWPYADVRSVWEARRSRHPGRCIVTNAHWCDPGPNYIGNYKIDGRVLSEQYPQGQWGFGWNAGALPEMRFGMREVDNFVSTIPALVDGERQWLDYGGGVTRKTTRTWLGVDGDGRWTVEVTTEGYTLEGIVERMEALGIVDGMVFDGSGSSQWYDGETRITGDGRTVYSYLVLWFEDGEKEEDDVGIEIIDAKLKFNGTLQKRSVTDTIILHHSAGSGTVEAVHNYHLSLGWKGIGYHYYVRRNGKIYQGRPEDTVGGHTEGWNSRSVGICAEGNFETETMSAAQRDAIRALLLDVLTRYPGAQVIKHRDVAATACPGKNYPFDYITAPAEDEPAQSDEPDEPVMTWEQEQAAATDWVKKSGLSDGERPDDPVKRVELWVTLWRALGREIN